MNDKLALIDDSKPWYAEGLRFECTGCGQCCTGSPGYVWVTEEEIQNMAAFLQMPVDLFTRRFLRKVENRYSLVEFSKTYDCIFLKDKKCSVYSVRPKQCRTFPWWIHNLKSKESWESAAKYCEGIRPDAPIHSLEEIQTHLQT